LYPSIRQKELLHSICLLEYNYVFVPLECLSNVGEPTGATITCRMSWKVHFATHPLKTRPKSIVCGYRTFSPMFPP